LQPEAYYVLTKSETDGISTSSGAIQIPAMLGLRFLNLGLFSLHIMGGPCWTLPMNETNSLSGTSQMNWLVGTGIDILGFITADIRYSYLTDTPINDQISNFNFKTTPLNLTVGLKLK
jgi:hypothetical protein